MPKIKRFLMENKKTVRIVVIALIILLFGIILYKSFRISIRVLLASLLLLIVFGDSFSGCVDFILGLYLYDFYSQ